jgi:hypothetical protein
MPLFVSTSAFRRPVETVRQVTGVRNRTDAIRRTRNSDDTSFERQVLFAERVEYQQKLVLGRACSVTVWKRLQSEFPASFGNQGPGVVKLSISRP